MKSQHAGVVFIGPIPPPVHGMAMVSQTMVQDLSTYVPVEMLVVQSNTLVRKFTRHFSKARSATRALFALPGAKARGARLLYLAVDDGLGGLWAILFASLSRALGLKLFLHHHSYRYIVKRRLVMYLLVRAAGAKARHVMLCDDMKLSFARLYPIARHFCIAPNSVEQTAPATKQASPPPTLTIGMLSNLTFEKGAGEFVGILERLRTAGLDVRGKIAGPAPVDEVERFLIAKQHESDGILEWVGPVAGDAKEQFFRSIDIFVFPTRYPTESFGLVLLEALLRGVPVVAPRRGCICLFETLAAAKIVPLGENFADRACAFIERLYRDRSELTRLAAAAACNGSRLNAAHRQQQLALVARMVEEARAL